MRHYVNYSRTGPAGFYPRAILPTLNFVSNLWWDEARNRIVGLNFVWWDFHLTIGIQWKGNSPS